MPQYVAVGDNIIFIQGSHWVQSCVRMAKKTLADDVSTYVYYTIEKSNDIPDG